MSSKSLPALHLTVETSWPLRCWTNLVHAIAALAILITKLPFLIQGLFLFAIGLSLLSCTRQQRLRSPLELILEPEGDIRLSYPDGTCLTGRLLDSSVSTTLVVILQMRVNRKTTSLLIDRYATDPESFRRLRVTMTCLPRPHRSTILPF